MVLGDGGIIAQAQKASQYADTSQAESGNSLNKLLEEYNNAMASTMNNDISSDDESNDVDETESYVGYYADVDGDGTVDGIIFADLAIGGGSSDTYYGSASGVYEITAVDTESLKEYYISEETYSEDPFETDKGIITEVEGTTGEDRFYVMALENVDDEAHYWYYDSYWWYQTGVSISVFDGYDIETCSTSTNDFRKRQRTN